MKSDAIVDVVSAVGEVLLGSGGGPAYHGLTTHAGLPLQTPALPPSPAPRAALDMLEYRLDRQHLLIQTLLRLLLAKGVLTEPELREWVAYVDKFDGRADGRLRHAKGPVACPACSRNSPREATKCGYCGAELPGEILQPAEGDEPGMAPRG